MTEQIAFLTYETKYAPCGGIAAVMNYLPINIQAASKARTIVITPYHHRIKKTAGLLPKMIPLDIALSVPYDGRQYKITILRYKDNGEIYFLKAADRRFFGGRRHPYDVGRNQKELGEILLRDSLFFGRAAAQALTLIEPKTDWCLMMQDWETATAALALAGKRKNVRLFLTLHNSYDSGLSDRLLRRFKIDPDACPGDTVLRRALPLVERPVFTVSGQFARDFTEDIFQKKLMIPHLQRLLRSRLIGINNGLFTKPALSNKTLRAMITGNYTSIDRWKAKKKKDALTALDALKPSKDKPVWGDINLFKHDDAPWFVMAGRDDPRQKGYDVAARAIEQFLDNNGVARFLFFPIPGDEGHKGLGFLKNLAERHPESVLVLPFLFKAGFFAALQGSAYGIMPSLYEPFGMANEFYLNATVGIGRATGGIVQQIVPYKKGATYNKDVERMAARWHSKNSRPTGLLYRESAGNISIIDDWAGINAAAYKIDGGAPNRVEERARYKLFEAMADMLNNCITDAVALYDNNRDLYYKMLTDGIIHIQKNFSWKLSAKQYMKAISNAKKRK